MNISRKFLIDVLALTEVTKFSHDGSGLESLDFSIIILCPFLSMVFGGLISPSTVPETKLLPRSVCIAYAKSINVDFLGNSIISPFDENTYTFPGFRSSLILPKNSVGLPDCFCISKDYSAIAAL